MSAASSAPLLMRIVAASVTVSHRASLIIRDIMKTGELGIVEKGRNDLQTEADRSAQQCIVASLQKTFPKVTIKGEEQELSVANVRSDWIESGLDDEVLQKTCPEPLRAVTDDQVVIWVDPLDGTAEYTQGLLDHVTVLIGVAVNGKACAGIICQPYYNYQAGPEKTTSRVIWGVVGLGSYGYNKHSLAEGSQVITTTRSHSNQVVNDAVNACKPTEILRVGGAGHKVLLLIEHQAHAYVFASPGCKKWDTCSPEAVLHALGGTLTDIHGNSLTYEADVKFPNTGGVLATLSNHQWYLDQIPASVKEALKP